MLNDIQLLIQEFPTMKLYIDPATTSYLIQIIAGVVISLGAVAGIVISKIKRAFRKEKKDNVQEEKKIKENKIVTADDLLDEEE